MEHSANAAPPSEKETLHYYDGLVSKPLLVARTSDAPFPPSPPFLTPEESEERAFPYDTKWSPRSVSKSMGPIDGLLREFPRAASTSEVASPKTPEQHEIVRAWCPALREALVAALDRSPLAACWSIFYTVRMTSQWRRAPDRVRPTSAVVLLVGIDVTSTSALSIPQWKDAFQAVMACRDVLAAWGVHGVEVEVLTTRIVDLQGDAGSDQRSNSGNSDTGDHNTDLEALMDVRSLTEPGPGAFRNAVMDMDISSLFSFLDYPGEQLERTLPTAEGSRPSGSWGSLGLYLGLGGPDVFALTSRHVAVGPRLPSGQVATQDDHIPVLWGTQETLSERAALLRRSAWEMKSTSETMTRRLTRLVETTDSNKGKADRLEAEISKRTWYAHHYLPRLADALEALARNDSTASSTATIPAKRLLGYVAHAGPQGRTHRGAWNDWALVRLTDDCKKAVRGHENANAVFIDSPKYADFVYSARQWSTSPVMISSPHELGTSVDGHFLPLQNRAPDVSNGASPLSTRRPRWVAKRGAKTELTFGIAGELEAVFRRTTSDGTFVTAYALPVLEYRGDAAFSSAGDSGSAVFDMEGNVVGLVDAGAGSKDRNENVRPDVTLVTPIEWVFENIREVTGKTPVLL